MIIIMIVIVIIIIIIIIIINIFFPFVWSLHFGGKQWNVGMRRGRELGGLFVLMSLAIVTPRREKRAGFCTLSFCFAPPPPPTKNKTYVVVSIAMFPQRSS